MSKPTIPTTGNDALDGELLDIRKQFQHLQDQIAGFVESASAFLHPPVATAPPVTPLTGSIEVKQTDGTFDQYVQGIEVDQADIVAAASGNLAKLNLASLIVAGGPIGDATHVAAVTFDAKGRLLTVTSVPITFPSGGSGIPVWPRVTKSADYSVQVTDCIIQVNGAGHTITLPALASVQDGQIFVVKSMTNNTDVVATGGVNIDANPTWTVTAGNSVMIYADLATQWWVAANL